MQRVLFTPAARLESIEAQDWYECAAKGLGQRFRSEIDKAVQRMRDMPVQFPLVYKTARRVRVNVFPFSLSL